MIYAKKMTHEPIMGHFFVKKAINMLIIQLFMYKCLDNYPSKW